MAVTLATPLRRYMFSSELSRLSFVTDSESAVLAISRDGAEVFRCEYFPDFDGRVTVYDLDKLLEAEIPDRLGLFSVSIGGERVSPDGFTVIRCPVAVSEPAESFIGSFFLTPCAGERDTAPGRFETLTALCPVAEPMVVERSFLTPDGSIRQQRETSELDAGWRELDVSSSRYIDPAAGRLLSYSVRVGNRVARYRVFQSLPEANPALIFRDSFGAWETVYFTGTNETAPDYKRSQAMVGGKLRPYLIEETEEHKALTGPLRPSMVPVVADLCRSKEIFLLNPDGSAGDEVVVTDCDLKRADEHTAPVVLSVTYRLADRLNARVNANRPPRVFDKHFDDKFN